MFSTDGKTIVTADSSGLARLWDSDTGRKTGTLKYPGTDSSLALTPDGKTVLSKTSYGVLKLWDLEKLHEIWSFRDGEAKWGSLAISPDGTLALSGNVDKTVSLLDLASGKRIRSFTGHTNLVQGVAFSPDGSLAASASWDQTLRMWDVTTGREIHSFTGHTDGVNGVEFAPDGTTLASASFDNTIRFWDLACAQRYRDFLPRVDKAIATLQDKPDDAESLKCLGEWYYYRGLPDWGAELLERARANGATVEALALARCYWERGNVQSTIREFKRALEQKEAPEYYLRLCLEAVDSQGK